MRRAAWVTVAIAVLASAAHPASAQQKLCSERAHFLKHLGQNYHERPAAMGLASNGSMLEILTSESGTWTIIITNPEGLTCLVAAGEAWETMPRLAMKPSV